MNRKPITITFYELLIIGTGAFAFLHSTWAIATFFSGPEPDRVANGVQWGLWLAEGCIFAGVMDIGQVVTAMLIRAGKNTRGYKLTFAVFALATYITQFLYIIAHVPLVPIAAGVAEQYLPVAKFVRDATIFVLPAMLPVSTTLYTFSHGADSVRAKPVPPPTKWIVQEPVQTTALIVPETAVQTVDAKCDQCEWFGEGYATQLGADRALRAHKQHAHKEV